MLRAGLLIALAGCGRIDFDPLEYPDDGIPDLVVAYPMDTAANARIPATVAAYAGSCNPCPARVPGIRGDGAYHFDGTALIDLPPVTSGLVGASPYTVSLWTKSSVAGTPRVMVSKPYDAAASDSDTFLFGISYADMGVLYETTANGTMFTFLQSLDVNINDNAWHHLTARYDGTTKSLALDGVVYASQDTAIVDSAEPLRLGHDIDRGAIKFQHIGALDDLRFYDRALTDAEIELLAQP